MTPSKTLKAPLIDDKPHYCTNTGHLFGARGDDIR